MQLAKIGDLIESDVTFPLPGTLQCVLRTPESVQLANRLLSHSDSGWKLNPRIPESNSYRCGVLNCGDGKCIHQILDERCPHCNSKMVLVTPTGHRFCSNHEYFCDYEASDE